MGILIFNYSHVILGEFFINYNLKGVEGGDAKDQIGNS
jgi:hypothetical protein